MAPVPEFIRDDLLRMEKEMLGIYLTDHPLNDVREKIVQIINMDTGILSDPNKIAAIKNGTYVTMAGLITNVRKMITKKGAQMAFLSVEDLYGQIEVVVFARTFEAYRQNLEEDRIVVIRGKLDLAEEGSPKLLAESVLSLDQALVKTAMVKVVIPSGFTDQEGLNRFKSIARQHLGDMPVAILVTDTGHKFKPDYDLWVDPCDEFYEKLHEAFGEDCLR